jgi:hypothetical protein
MGPIMRPLRMARASPRQTMGPIMRPLRMARAKIMLKILLRILSQRQRAIVLPNRQMQRLAKMTRTETSPKTLLLKIQSQRTKTAPLP